MLRGRWRSMWVRVSIVLVVLSTARCVIRTGFISEQQARVIAVRSASSGHLRATEPPSILQAELMPLGVAEKRLAQNGDSGRTQAPTRMAWLVTLEGTWTLVGGPPTPMGTGPAPQTIFHHYAIILDAKTGQPISETATD